jgi:DNA invertase Pin-like site-specific DNA recombinase
VKAVIYARYSSDNQREESIEGQLRECKEYAEKNGITVLSSYIDRALSAKTDNRPEFQRMIKDSAKRLFDIVIVWKLDRFARNRYDSAHYKAILRKNGVKVVSAKEAIAEDSTGILLESLLEGYAEFYSAELSEKILRGMKENALKCKYNGGAMPLGYTSDSDQHYQIDPLTAPIVREIFERYADGETIKEIITSLNERGLRTNLGKPFNNNSLHAMLKNRHYLGEYKYRDIVTPNAFPAIISKELFDRVQIRIEKNKRAPARKKAYVDYLLTTKLFCGECGAFMIGDSGTSRTGKTYYYYKCSHAKRGKTCKKKAIKKEVIEHLVVAETKNLILQDELIEKIADAVIALQGKENTTLPLLHQQLQEVEKGIENMLNAIQQGVLTSSTKKRLDDLESQKENLEISIAQEQIKRPLLTKDKIIFWISRFKDGDIDDPKYRQNIIDLFLNSVYVYDDRLIITCNYKDGARTVSLSDINGSDLVDYAPPKKALNFQCFRLSINRHFHAGENACFL